MFTPVYPSSTDKMGFKGVYIAWTCFPDAVEVGIFVYNDREKIGCYYLSCYCSFFFFFFFFLKDIE